MSSRQSRSLSTQSTQTGRSLMPNGTAVDTPNGSLEMLARFVGRRISCPAPRLFVEPYVFQSEIVDDAVCHHRPALDPRLPAISKAVVEDDRSRAIRGELSLDLPNQLLALIDVALGRLPIETASPAPDCNSLCSCAAHRSYNFHRVVGPDRRHRRP